MPGTYTVNTQYIQSLKLMCILIFMKNALNFMCFSYTYLFYANNIGVFN